jgi:capsular polysaccharide biosynthesis protein
MGQGVADASDAGSARGRVQDEDQTVTLPRVDAGQARAEDYFRAQEVLRDLPWPDDDAAAAAERPAAELASSLVTGLATFPYLGQTIRRRARLWCIMGAVGLVVGLGLHFARPPAYRAMTSVEITNSSDQNPIDAIGTEVALVQSRAVGSQAEHDLGLTENINKFLASYSAADITDRIISITVSASSPQDALSRAAKLAQVFLQFQARQLRAEQQGVSQQLNQQIGALYQQIGADNTAIARAKAADAGSSQKLSLSRLTAQRSRDLATLDGLQKALQDYQLNNQVTNDQIVSGSAVLDSAALLPPSKLKSPVVYAVGGLAAGIVVGIGIVVIGALVSDRLRRRDDIARALAAPVQLSVGRVRARPWPGRRGLAGARDRRVQRVVAYLDGLLPQRGSRRAPALAVIPFDAPRTGALAVASLALTRAQRGEKVVLADLVDGAPAARLLGVRKHGTHVVDVGERELIVVVPDGLGPSGPLGKSAAQEHQVRAGADPDAAAAYGRADLMLTLAAADPAMSADYLRTWGTGSVVLVTAGRNSASKIHATAEMIRLAGLPIVSAVLLGNDRTDDSVGTWPPPGQDADRDYAANGPIAPADAFLSAVVRGDRSS